MKNFHYDSFDALGLAELVSKGEVSAAEVTEAAIARIERLNPALNAVVTKLYDMGRENAARGPSGMFGGVPFLLKDISGDIAGVETRCGSRFKAGLPAARDHSLVERYKQAGVIILGKTNVPEFGMLPTTEGDFYGAARNPWNPLYSTGGSSGGAAAAVAAGIVPIAHGGDAGGSIRMPASCCGLVGLKPTRGRNPVGPDAGELMAGFLQEHILSRSVRDSAAMLDCTHGPEPGDPYCAPPAPRSYLAEVGRDPGRLRIAVTTANLAGNEAEAECIAGVNATVALLTELGHIVEPVRLPVGMELYANAMAVGAACIAQEIDAHARIAGKEPNPDEIGAGIWQLYRIGRSIGASDYLSALTVVHVAAREMARFMQRFDAWLTPTIGRTPVKLGTIDPIGSDSPENDRLILDFLSYVLIGNATGQPAISLPLYWTSDGLPVGMMFTGRFGDEAGLFRLAGQLEQARPWAGRRPPLWAGDVE